MLISQVGRKVMAGCCETLKPVVLELGGKDPFVVCDDADIERVMPFVMKGSFFNAGQNCIGVERVYVYEKVRGRLFLRRWRTALCVYAQLLCCWRAFGRQ